MQGSIRKFALPLLILVFCCRLPAEERPTEPPAKPEIPNLHGMVERSGYVFAGTVKSVERIKPRSQDRVGVMRITFYVDKAYRGLRTGQIFAIHEWAGLWESGERYRRGERVMLFLYPPSSLGLTSPVPNGRFPVDHGGRIVVPSPRRWSVGGLPRGQLPPNRRISFRDLSLALRRAEQE